MSLLFCLAPNQKKKKKLLTFTNNLLVGQHFVVLNVLLFPWQRWDATFDCGTPWRFFLLFLKKHHYNSILQVSFPTRASENVHACLLVLRSSSLAEFRKRWRLQCWFRRLFWFVQKLFLSCTMPITPERNEQLDNVITFSKTGHFEIIFLRYLEFICSHDQLCNKNKYTDGQKILVRKFNGNLCRPIHLVYDQV